MSSSNLTSYFRFQDVNWPNVWSAAWETVWMTVASVVIVAILGILLGLLLYETSGSKSKAVKGLNLIVALFVNIFKVMFFILFIWIKINISHRIF